ncbi:hypothetical protein [Streptomyces sp. NPDC059247]|uniref:hypothetical protein n=1 Tax=Streptomyces sp. NPDC059247 TaxID=3346790 RepID=UPI003688313A
MILLAAASGLRQGEVFGMETDCADFLRREVVVRQQLVTSDKGDREETPESYLGEPKTHESCRTVPLVGSAVDALAAHLQQYPAALVEIEDRTDPRKPRRRKVQLLFTSGRTDVIKRANWAHVRGRMEIRAKRH